MPASEFGGNQDRDAVPVKKVHFQVDTLSLRKFRQ